MNAQKRSTRELMNCDNENIASKNKTKNTVHCTSVSEPCVSKREITKIHTYRAEKAISSDSQFSRSLIDIRRESTSPKESTFRRIINLGLCHCFLYRR